MWESVCSEWHSHNKLILPFLDFMNSFSGLANPLYWWLGKRTSAKYYKDITNAIAKYIAKNMVPHQMIVKEAFKMLTAWQLCLNCMTSVCSETEESHFATTDLWSSQTPEPYISLTLHFINEACQLQCLSTTDTQVTDGIFMLLFNAEFSVYFFLPVLMNSTRPVFFF